jgi:uncharacterized membrane protein YhaH (DUF805 family)
MRRKIVVMTIYINNNLKLKTMANFISSFTDVITKRYAQFKGRANRQEYWVYTIILCVILYILFFIAGKVPAGGAQWTVFIIAYAILLATLVPSLAVVVRRLHDIGKAGGWIFINLIPIIGGIWFLILMLKGGEPAENRFGAPQA